jgi:hypothetical protein
LYPEHQNNNKKSHYTLWEDFSAQCPAWTA